MGAAPIGAPGCPEFAFWTASIESVRIVSIASWSSDWATVIGATPLGRSGARLYGGGWMAPMPDPGLAAHRVHIARYPRAVPSLPRRDRRAPRPHVVVLGDLMLD